MPVHASVDQVNAAGGGAAPQIELGSNYFEDDYFVDRYIPSTTGATFQKWSTSSLPNISNTVIFHSTSTIPYDNPAAFGEMWLVPTVAGTAVTSGLVRRQNGSNNDGLVRPINGCRWTSIAKIITPFDGVTNIGGIALGVGGKLDNSDYNMINGTAMFEARSGSWECVISQDVGATRVSPTIGGAITASLLDVTIQHNLAIEKAAGTLASTAWRFFIDGVLVVTLGGANMPTINMNPFFALTRTGGNNLGLPQLIVEYYSLSLWKQ